MNKLIKQITWNNVANNDKIQEYVDNYAKDLNCYIVDLIVEDNNVSFTAYSRITYENLVNKLVKEHYTDSEEFAILRKAINEITDEFLIYNAYVEECKVRAKEYVAERERVING